MMREAIRKWSRQAVRRQSGHRSGAMPGAGLALGVCLALYVPLCLAPAANATAEEIQGSGPQHGIAMHGEPALPRGFSHFPYVNAEAPKGGKLTIGFQNAFDSLNPFNLKAGSAARGLIGNVFQTLMMRSQDEPFTLYGLIAETIETDPDRTWVEFRLNSKARFSDGSPVTSRDIRFTVELLREKGRPQHRAAFGLVKSIATPDERTVRFDLSGANDRELPLILALMPVLPAHATDAETFSDASLKTPVGSGPYRVSDFRPGEFVVYVRDKNYWGKDLPVHRGFYNFDEIRIEYFRDGASLFEAFKAGLLDYMEEDSPTRWRSGYDFPALRDGRIKRIALPLGGAKGMRGFAFNTRRAVFADVKVREALAMMFDFEWINANIYGGQYKRTRSFFDNTPLSAKDKPASEAEKRLLARWPGVVRTDILAGRYRLPVSDGTGRDRKMARAALGLLNTAGYRLKDAALVNTKTSRQLAFEILVSDREQERLALLYAQSLRRIGVDADVRQVDQVQYQRRRQKFDFDMIMGWWIASNSPGNEQRNRWSQMAADLDSSFNLAGARSPAIDGLIQAMLAARSTKDFQTAVRAYDRVLQSGFYIIPLFHKAEAWVAHWNKISYPKRLPQYAAPLFGETLETWWSTRK